jgi:hypothetical protein
MRPSGKLSGKTVFLELGLSETYHKYASAALHLRNFDHLFRTSAATKVKVSSGPLSKVRSALFQN